MEYTEGFYHSYAKAMEQERKMFELSIADFPAEEKAATREKRRLEQREDRKHRELCQAIRDSKPERQRQHNP